MDSRSQYGLQVGWLGVVAALWLGGCVPGGSFRHEAARRYYVGGQLLAAEGDYDAALAELAKAIERDPDFAAAHEAAGDIHRKRGSYELARKSYEAACDVNPYAFRPHYNLGVTYQYLADASETMQQVTEHLRDAVRVYLRAIEIRPEDFDANLNLAACYFRIGKQSLAEQSCLRAIELNPDSAEAHSNLGIIYDALDRPYDAIREYKRSLELDSDQPVILLNLGATYLKQGRLKRALDTFEVAARRQPENPEPWAQIGLVKFHRKDLDGALEAYRKAVELEPDHAAAQRGLGVVYMSMFLLDRSETRYRDKALGAWNASLEADPRQNDLVKLVRKYTPEVTGPEL